MATEKLADIGLIGLAVMGENLALNIADHGFRVAVYNRTTKVMKDFIAANPDTPGGLIGCATLPEPEMATRFPAMVSLPLVAYSIIFCTYCLLACQK